VYDYRKWNTEERAAAVKKRADLGFPLHSPLHVTDANAFRIITGTCFEHKPVLKSLDHLQWFELQLKNHLEENSIEVVAWVVLPNHYHFLARIADIRSFVKSQGELHGRTSFELNKRDNQIGRQVWYRCSDRIMRSERHYFTTINYMHNNPVKHGTVEKWGDWPFSSFHWYLKNKGREWLIEMWREFPVLEYGKRWDNF